MTDSYEICPRVRRIRQYLKNYCSYSDNKVLHIEVEVSKPPSPPSFKGHHPSASYDELRSLDVLMYVRI